MPPELKFLPTLHFLAGRSGGQQSILHSARWIVNIQDVDDQTRSQS